MKDIKDFLQEQSLFQNLPAELLELVTGCGQNVHFKTGEYLGQENDDADYFYIIRKGKVAVQINHPSKGPMTILTLSNGDYGGFSWIIPPYRMQFDLKAIESTSAVALDGKCLRKKCEEDYQLGYLFMKQAASIMVKRLQETRMQLLDVYRERV